MKLIKKVIGSSRTFSVISIVPNWIYLALALRLELRLKKNWGYKTYLGVGFEDCQTAELD